MTTTSRRQWVSDWVSPPLGAGRFAEHEDGKIEAWRKPKRLRIEFGRAGPVESTPAAWARGAAGSASEWHSEGQGSESPRVHQPTGIRTRVLHKLTEPDAELVPPNSPIPHPEPLEDQPVPGPSLPVLRREVGVAQAVQVAERPF